MNLLEIDESWQKVGRTSVKVDRRPSKEMKLYEYILQRCKKK